MRGVKFCLATGQISPRIFHEGVFWNIRHCMSLPFMQVTVPIATLSPNSRHLHSGPALAVCEAIDTAATRNHVIARGLAMADCNTNRGGGLCRAAANYVSPSGHELEVDGL